MSANLPTALPSLGISSLSANICAELAAGLSDVEGIKARYELSDEQWNRLKTSPVFREMLKESIARLRGDLNAGKRITIKSEIALEDSIPLLHRWAHDNEIAISNRLDAIKQMGVLAGRNGREAGQGQGGPAGPGFNINITVKGHSRRESIEVMSTPALEAEAYESED